MLPIAVSLPARERGLKSMSRKLVSACAGAWIEIISRNPNMLYTVSLPARERGLKFISLVVKILPSKSLPARERGLKLPTGRADIGTVRRSLRGSVD